MRRLIVLLFAGSALAGLSACGAKPETDHLKGELRMSMQGSNDDPAIVKRREAYRNYLGEVTGRPVKLYEASDYNGVIQALASGQVDVATLAGGGYANVDAQVGGKVMPILTTRRADGGTGYYSALIVKADSPFKSIADLKGRSLGYVDFNSTSGYLYPRAKMRAAGINPETYFSKVAFAGGHTQAVMALVNGQFDATFVQVSGGDPEHGFTTGGRLHHGPAGACGRRGLSNHMGGWPGARHGHCRPDGSTPIADRYRKGAMAALAYDQPDLWTDIGQPAGSEYTAIGRQHYAEVIALRNDDIAQRRTGSKDIGAPK